MKIIRPKTFDMTDLNLKRWHEDLFKLFNRNISYGQGIDTPDQNIDGKMVDIPDTGLANTQFIVIHNLNRIPNFYDVKYQNLATSIFDSGTAWTKTQIFLKSSIAHVHIRLFVH
jgi:hypothetical protein